MSDKVTADQTKPRRGTPRRPRCPGPPPCPWWLELVESADGKPRYEMKPLEGAAVHYMFLARNAGLTSEMIAQHMPERYQLLKEDGWDERRIAEILRNPAATGILKPNIRGPAVINREGFEGAEKVSRAHQRGGQRKGNFNRFARSARCKSCGELMRIRRAGGDLVCTNRQGRCPARSYPWALKDVKAAVIGVVNDIDRKKLRIELKEIEVRAAKFELSQQKRLAKRHEQRTRRDGAQANGAALNEKSGQIEQLQNLISRLAGELRALREERATECSSESTTIISEVDLERVNAVRMERLVHDIVVAPAGTAPGIEARRRMEGYRVEVNANFDFDLTEGIEALRGEKLLWIRFNDGEEVVCWPDKNDPAEISYQYSTWDQTDTEKGRFYSDDLLFAMPLPMDLDSWSVLEIRAKKMAES